MFCNKGLISNELNCSKRAGAYWLCGWRNELAYHEKCLSRRILDLKCRNVGWRDFLSNKLFKIKMPWSVPRESYSRYVAGPDTGVLWDTKKTWPEDVLFEDHHHSILLRSERCGAVSVSHSVMPDSLQPHGPAVHQAPLSKGSSKQGYWSGCHVLLWWSNEVTQKGTGWLGELIWHT